MAGTTFAQAMGIVVAPLLTRLYSPEDFGTVAYFVSILGIFSVVANGRYELAIVLPENDEDSANLLTISIVSAAVISVVAVILVALFRVELANSLNAPQLQNLLWIFPISLLLTGVFQPLSYWCVRRNQFKRLSLRTVSQSLVAQTLQVGTGMTLHLGATGMIAGTLFGQMAAVGYLVWQIARDEGKKIFAMINVVNLKQTLRRYKRFPLFDSWSGLLNTVSTMLPTLLLGYFFQPAIVGYYSLGQRVLTMPMSILGGSVAQVFSTRAVEAKRNGDLADLTLKLFRKLMEIGLVPIVLITLIAPDLFTVIFGAKWVTAGHYIRWLAIWLFLVFISSPLSVLYSVLEKQREGLIVNVVMFSTRLVALIVGGMSGDAFFAIKLFGIVGAFLWLFNCAYIIHIAGVSIRAAFLEMLRQMFFGLAFAIFPIGIWYVNTSSWHFLMAGIFSGIAYLLLLMYRAKFSGGCL